jgi:hypothetical protein
MDFGMPVLIFFPNDRRSARVGYGNHREAVLCFEYCFLRIRRAKKSAGRAEAHPRVGCGENSVCETAVGEAGVLYAVLTAPLG